MDGKNMAAPGALIGWLAVVWQFWLMMQVSEESTLESVVRFFSFFTILTNILVAAYFTMIVLARPTPFIIWMERNYVLTAITVFISIVCLVYQVILRSTWSPEGAQKFVDELLHTIIPLYFIFYWWRFEKHPVFRLRQFLRWLTYPLIYLIYILVRGSISGFYPYPFVDVTQIGMSNVLINSAILFGIFIVVAGVFILIDRKWRGRVMMERSR